MENTFQQHLHRHRDRVREHSAETVNRRIDQLTESSVNSALRGGRDAVQRRLAELDHEWDVDRALMLNFAVVGALTFALGIRRYGRTLPFVPRRKGFLYVFGTQLAFLAMHAVVGWCPPAPVFRRLGFRTRPEIEAERLQLIRGVPRATAAGVASASP